MVGGEGGGHEIISWKEDEEIITETKGNRILTASPSGNDAWPSIRSDESHFYTRLSPTPTPILFENVEKESQAQFHRFDWSAVATEFMSRRRDGATKQAPPFPFFLFEIECWPQPMAVVLTLRISLGWCRSKWYSWVSEKSRVDLNATRGFIGFFCVSFFFLWLVSCFGTGQLTVRSGRRKRRLDWLVSAAWMAAKNGHQSAGTVGANGRPLETLRHRQTVALTKSHWWSPFFWPNEIERERERERSVAIFGSSVITAVNP